MSSEETQNDSNSENNKIDYKKLDINELKKQNPFVLDLLVKIDVLKKGVIDERKKTSILISKVKSLEEELTTKNDEIKKLLQEKANNEEKKTEEINKLNNEDNNQINNNCNNNVNKKIEIALSLAKDEIRKLNEEITNLKLEKENSSTKINKTIEDTEDIKKEYQTQIKLLSEANNSIIKELKNLKSENKNLQKQLDEKIKIENTQVTYTPPPELLQERVNLIHEKEQLISENAKLIQQKEQLLREKEHFENLIKDYKKSKDEAMIQLDAILKKNGQLVLENQTFKDSIYTHEINSGKMAQKLAEFKNMVLNLNLRNQVFHVKKLGLISHNDIDIIFGKDKDGNYVMRIDEKNNSDLINILDVESVSQNSKNKNKVDISYMHKSKKYNISVLVNELIVDQFIDAYKIFYSESMKRQNKVNI